MLTSEALGVVVPKDNQFSGGIENLNEANGFVRNATYVEFWQV